MLAVSFENILRSVTPFIVKQDKIVTMSSDKERGVSRDNPGETHFAIRKTI